MNSSAGSSHRLPQRTSLVIALALSLVLAVAAYLRLVGLNWDEFEHLHPDERFLTMVEGRISPVKGGLTEYFDSEISSLNPYNHDFNFFVYGTAPIFVVRYVAEWLENSGLQIADFGIASSLILGTGYDQIHLVGRAVSAIADILTVGVLYLIGRRLWEWRVGLLAAALGSGTVALIQQAHFFTVDSLANLFVTLGLLFAVQVQYDGRLRNYLLFGVTLGLAMASRINTAPLALVIVLASFVYFRRKERQLNTACVCSGAVRILLAAVLTVLVFRVAQPYAFSGPSFLHFGLSEQWIQNMKEIRSMMSGDVDIPFNHQWTNRTNFLFPLQNMVLWGMGLGLGLAAWAGFIWAGWWLVLGKRDWEQHLIPVVWTSVYFAWQATRWVKPIRYFLPIYPTMILLGAWALVTLTRILTTSYRSRNSVRFMWPVSYVPVVLVLTSTLLYGLAFTRIYTRPVTRVAASRWIFENIPGPLSVVIETGDGKQMQPVPVAAGFQYIDDRPYTHTFVARETGLVREVAIGRLTDVLPDTAAEVFNLAIRDGSDEKRLLGTATLTEDLSRKNSYVLDIEPPVEVSSGRTYQIISRVIDGGVVTIEGAHLVNESTWDDGLPLRMDGYDPFGGIYVGHNLELYWDDDEAKLERMLDVLDQGDYILISSNRQYDSIPRLPMRYPLTVAYYKALFSGELGFELLHEFESFPTLGSWVVSDRAAEETFTVYDHPRVLIFRKLDNFSLDKVRNILGGVDLSSVVWMNPRQATEAPSVLMLPPDRLAEQRAGGTWSEMFDYGSIPNSSQAFGVVLWLGVLMVIGWMIFPITFLAFRGLPDKGYAVTKVLGILLIAYLTWLLASARLTAFSRGTLWCSFAAISGLSGFICWRDGRSLCRWIWHQRRYIILVEALWLGLFLFDLFIRWNNPDLWHPSYGGEKPMDFSYFNAVLRSTSFPPFDPWFAGGYINYYYFGYVIVGVLTKMLGIVPAIAYNMILPMLFAMSGMGAFCLAYNLVAARGRTQGVRTSCESANRQWRSSASPHLAGISAATMMVLLGNLGQVDTIATALKRAAADTPVFSMPVIGTVQRLVIGLYQMLFEGKNIHMSLGDWYWNATRIIPHLQNESAPITEFPLFTFLYADLHAHMIALPLTLLSLAWALSVITGAQRTRRWPEWVVHWMIGGVVLGALGPTNTWDFPTYLGLGCVALAYAQLRHNEHVEVSKLARGSWRIVLLIGLSTVLYSPYSRWYGAGYTSLAIWDGSRTGVGDYLKIHGLFLFILATFLVSETRIWMQNTRLQEFRIYGSVLWQTVAVVAALGGVMIMLLLNHVNIAAVVLPLIVWAIAIMLLPCQVPAKRVVLALLALGLVLTMVVELVRLQGDISRMNTVFKFYLQVWTLFSVAAGAGLAWVWQQMPEWRPRNALRWKAGLAILLLVSASYTMLAVSAKMRDRITPVSPPTLDGMDYMRYAEYHDQGKTINLAPDYGAIRWLQDNVIGSPVIVEAHTSEYKYGSRYTINTGLPGVVGWSWHQRQQRAVTPSSLVTDRVDEISRFYRGTDISAALAFLNRHDVRYVVIGEYERAYYTGKGLNKFDEMVKSGLLLEVYEYEGARILEVPSP